SLCVWCITVDVSAHTDHAPVCTVPHCDLSATALTTRVTSSHADVLSEHARVDLADTLVLVYPIYWWSMPALLKGWIYRVFCTCWAFDYSIHGDLRKKLQRLREQLVCDVCDVDGTIQRAG
ncbi:hypothetical protein GOY11_34020, partial [Pseudomonas aeruginosa]|nr:hypothetical protein [Pseudomonas aeruginosa]